MTSEMGQDKKGRSAEELLSEFCSCILIKNDELNFDSIDKYVLSLTKSEIELLRHSDLEMDCLIVRNKLMTYIQSYQTSTNSNQPSSPFDFDSGKNTLSKYREKFEDVYKKYTEAKIPKVLSSAFDAIQEMSEHYRVFEQFYIIRSRETTDSILNRATQKAEELARLQAEEGIKNGIKEAVQQASAQATARAEINAGIAAEQAKKASQEAENAASKAVDDAIKGKMNEVTKNISETSITILGIFAGIVLTVVAGLFYSSSVLDNINAANFCRLISLSALVGFVCYNLIALMFRYIERIKYDKDKAPRFSKLTTVISITLLLIMLIFGGLQYCDFNNPKDASQNKSTVDVNITTIDEEKQTDPSGLNDATEQNTQPTKSTPNTEENAGKDKK